jgi:hypothetical protein
MERRILKFATTPVSLERKKDIPLKMAKNLTLSLMEQGRLPRMESRKKTELVKLRCFADLKIEELAEILVISAP